MTFLEQHPAWHAYAPCVGLVDLFFAERGGDTASALAVCATCPYVEPCLAENLDAKHGIFGGTSPRQRQAIRMGRTPSYRRPGRPKRVA